MTGKLGRTALLMAVTAVSIGATAPQAATISGFEALAASPATTSLCTRDLMWCVSRDSDRAPILVELNGKEAGRWLPEAADTGLQVSALPSLLRLADGSVLIALQARKPVMYSGGGGEITALRLLYVKQDVAPRIILSLPWKTDLMIRACFSDKDAVRRSGACHDEYQLEGHLAVASPVKAAPPMLVYSPVARYSPRGISRNVDSLTLPPLKKSDLVWVRDDICSYRRTLRIDPANGAYKPDMPLPDCDQYTQQ